MPQTFPPTQPPAAGSPEALSPELVKQIADKVYAMLLADLRREAERQGKQARRRIGGS